MDQDRILKLHYYDCVQDKKTSFNNTKRSIKRELKMLSKSDDRWWYLSMIKKLVDEEMKVANHSG